MAKAKGKQAAKRKAARVYTNLEQALGHLADLHQLFAPSHPDYAEAIEVIARQIILVQSEWEDFWRCAWGEPPEHWESWAE